MSSEEGQCPHCGQSGYQNVDQHARNCIDRFSSLYKLAARRARRRMEGLGFDRRRRESGVFEYALLRYYADWLGLIVAAVFIIGRLYLWIDLGTLGSASLPFEPMRDGPIFALALWQLFSARTAISDFREHVVDRIERIAEQDGLGLRAS